MFLKIKKYLFLDDIFNMCSLTCYFFFLFNLFNQFNILIYIYLLIFQVLFLSVINDFLSIY